MVRTHGFLGVAGLLVVAALAACGSADSGQNTSSTSAAPPSSTTSIPDDEPGLRDIVAAATADLADRLAVDASSIATVRAEFVQWPDSSAGCPQPGRAYLQVITEGALVVIAHEGTEYEYHAGPQDDPFLCEDPQDPVQG